CSSRSSSGSTNARRTSGVEGSDLATENDRGTGAADPESPADKPANQGINLMSQVRPETAYAPAAVVLTSRGSEPVIDMESPDDDGAAYTEIDAAYRRRLIGLRRLPRHERIQALRAAREWRAVALMALRQKR